MQRRPGTPPRKGKGCSCWHEAQPHGGSCNGKPASPLQNTTAREKSSDEERGERDEKKKEEEKGETGPSAKGEHREPYRSSPQHYIYRWTLVKPLPEDVVTWAGVRKRRRHRWKKDGDEKQRRWEG
ncbi:hypothetical protein WN48_03514 [Eufriesea mexicana]|uniref:Uncharacterized protein n=1 Tax=Eufriesea mexicana TaxID=516756 RepID=A0A310SEQ6_9HYME|nr:hypothetical protein WN48_03514 [Eufriesea mexicana]